MISIREAKLYRPEKGGDAYADCGEDASHEVGWLSNTVYGSHSKARDKLKKANLTEISREQLGLSSIIAYPFLLEEGRSVFICASPPIDSIVEMLLWDDSVIGHDGRFDYTQSDTVPLPDFKFTPMNVSVNGLSSKTYHLTAPYSVYWDEEWLICFEQEEDYMEFKLRQ